MRQEQGDTIIEVMFAFAVFSLVVVSTIILMNRGLGLAQRSLEVTLVRQQIDTQVTLVQHARQMGDSSPVWAALRASAAGAPISISQITTCPSSADLSSGASNYFITPKPDKSDIVQYKIDANNYKPAPKHAFVDLYNATGQPVQTSYGIWMTLAEADDNGVAGNPAYDLYVRACWYSIGDKRPTVIGTVVRLYDTN